MKTVIVATIALLPFSALAQQADNFVPFPDNGVYLSAIDFAKHKLTDGFDSGQPGYRIRQETFQPTLKIDQPNASEEKIPLSALWGERKDGVDYRSFDGDLYRVEHSDRIYIYSKPTPAWMAMGGLAHTPTLYYFSRKADSPIHLITSQNLEDIYYDQPDKLAQFDQVDDLNNPANQANFVVRLFYTDTHSNQATE
ncbi:hypothetical protein [Spirosoma sp.]|uniref:hypothetical protein n=1 Tax=Spirosoma sp. TaxID=1899569 RepID=UPI003B3B40D3